jgi:hypothetical protein
LVFTLCNIMIDVLTRLDGLEQSHNIALRVKKAWLGRLIPFTLWGGVVVNPPRVRWSLGMSRIIVLVFFLYPRSYWVPSLHYVVIFLSFGLHMLCINSWVISVLIWVFLSSYLFVFNGLILFKRIASRSNIAFRVILMLTRLIM